MKKFWILLMMLFLFQTANASGIEVLPTMQTVTNSQNRVWVSTFQIVWNELMDKIVFGEVNFSAGTPKMAKELNKREVTTADINDKCYYKYVGKITKNTKQIIKNAIYKKFNETSDVLDKLDFAPGPEKYIVYAMLKKDFKFLNAFDKLGKSDFRNEKAEYFGISSRTNDKIKRGVQVLFYTNPAEYAVVLQTVDNDEVYLYKTSNENSFNNIYAEMLKKQQEFKGKKWLADRDELKVPDLKFYKERQFNELAGKRIKGTRLEIDKAIETVKFDMNNEGVKLKSEAVITTKCTSAGPNRVEKPRYFYFNDTFVLFLKEKGKANPYFALRVHDIKDFQR